MSPATSLSTVAKSPSSTVSGNATSQGEIDVTLRGVAETLLIPLAARAHDATTQNPILGDTYAQPVLEKLKYDFTKAALPGGPTAMACIAIRTKLFDRWTASFLAANTRCTILHLACGLDSRAQRLEWGNNVRWIDVDLPDVVALRRQVLPQMLPGRDYSLVAASVTEDAWLEKIPADRPTAVVMEGLLAYLEEKDVHRLLSRLIDRLGKGELMFESLAPSTLSTLRNGALKAVDQTGAEFRWAVDDAAKLQEIHPRMERLELVPFYETPGVERLPLLTRGVMYVLSWIPSTRDNVRFVRFGFSSEASH